MAKDNGNFCCQIRLHIESQMPKALTKTNTGIICQYSKAERERQRKFRATYREGVAGVARGQMAESKWLTLTHHAADSVVDGNNNNSSSTTSSGNEQLFLPFHSGDGREGSEIGTVDGTKLASLKGAGWHGEWRIICCLISTNRRHLQ